MQVMSEQLPLPQENNRPSNGAELQKVLPIRLPNQASESSENLSFLVSEINTQHSLLHYGYIVRVCNVEGCLSLRMFEYGKNDRQRIVEGKETMYVVESTLLQFLCNTLQRFSIAVPPPQDNWRRISEMIEQTKKELTQPGILDYLLFRTGRIECENNKKLLDTKYKAIHLQDQENILVLEQFLHGHWRQIMSQVASMHRIREKSENFLPMNDVTFPYPSDGRGLELAARIGNFPASITVCSNEKRVPITEVKITVSPRAHVKVRLIGLSEESVLPLGSLENIQFINTPSGFEMHDFQREGRVLIQRKDIPHE